MKTQKQKMATEKIKTIYHADPTKTKRVWKVLEHDLINP